MSKSRKPPRRSKPVVRQPPQHKNDQDRVGRKLQANPSDLRQLRLPLTLSDAVGGKP
jgi:hypothetical protein